MLKFKNKLSPHYIKQFEIEEIAINRYLLKIQTSEKQQLNYIIDWLKPYEFNVDEFCQVHFYEYQGLFYQFEKELYNSERYNEIKVERIF